MQGNNSADTYLQMQKATSIHNEHYSLQWRKVTDI